MKKITYEDYLKAAEIVATCRNDRLELVISLLERGGIDILNEPLSTAIKKRVSVNEMLALNAKESKELHFKDQWEETDDPLILALRDAFLNGTKVADIAALAGTPRTAIYEYLKGTRNYQQDTAFKLSYALKALGYSVPFYD